METVEIGYQLLVPLNGFGRFTATAHKIVGNKILFIFDDCVTEHYMNIDSTNEGGYENSDLKKWIDNTLFNAFPDYLKDRMSGLSIPSVGEIFGWDDDWYNQTFEKDQDERLLLMLHKQYRIARHKDKNGPYRLKNKCLCNFSQFASVTYAGHAHSSYASYDYIGVRPEFWLDVDEWELKEGKRSEEPKKSNCFDIWLDNDEGDSKPICLSIKTDCVMESDEYHYKAVQSLTIEEAKEFYRKLGELLKDEKTEI